MDAQQLAPMISPGPAASITLPPISSITSGPSTPANHEIYGQVPLPISCARCGRTDTPLWRRDDQGRSICNACGLASKPRSVQPRPTVSSTSSSQTMNGHPAPINEAPKGSCPGDGQCNGQGGRACCQGCPAYNNRHGRNHAFGPTSEPPAPVQQQPPEESKSADDSGEANLGGIQCENCGTRTTPLWRRDGDGRVACNACGLYWKLHGKHRPVNLNKPTIKRRKRIAPLINGPPSLRPMDGRVEVPSMPPNENQWAPMMMNGDHEQKRQRIASPHPEAFAVHLQQQQQPQPPLGPPRRDSSDPMAELADVASRLEPLPSTGTPPSNSFMPLPVPQNGPAHHHASHPHPHHHHVHHHHHHTQQQQPPLPRLDSMDELRGFRDALRDDLLRGRAELEHLRTSLARGEQVLEALDTKLGHKEGGGHLEELIARESNNTSLSVPLKRKKEET